MRNKLALAYVVIIAACGSRTALVGDESEESSPDDSGVTHKDAAQIPRDADVKLDGAPDVFRNDCPDAASTFIYLISEGRELFSYDVAGGIFRDIGTVVCPTPYTQTFSMAVDRQGTAYVLFWDGDTTNANGNLFRVSTATAACKAIPEYAPGQQGFQVYGTGFATNGGGPSESLYVMGGGNFGSSTGLATIDTTTFELTFIGQNNPAINEGELTGTGDGRLFGFFYFASDLSQSTPYLGEIDKTSGNLLSQTPLAQASAGSGFSVAYWGGDFYVFTVPDTMNTVATRYRPTDQTYVNVATLPNEVIVGAGVSTCAPQ